MSARALRLRALYFISISSTFISTHSHVAYSEYFTLTQHAWTR